jgi:hypothetical protein
MPWLNHHRQGIPPSDAIHSDACDMRFCFPNSHAYPGSPVRVRATGVTSDAKSCLIEFGDGIVVLGSYRRMGTTTVRLSIPAYATTKGTAIKANHWNLILSADGAWSVVGKPSPVKCDPT